MLYVHIICRLDYRVAQNFRIFVRTYLVFLEAVYRFRGVGAATGTYVHNTIRKSPAPSSKRSILYNTATIVVTHHASKSVRARIYLSV